MLFFLLLSLGLNAKVFAIPNCQDSSIDLQDGQRVKITVDRTGCFQLRPDGIVQGVIDNIFLTRDQEFTLISSIPSENGCAAYYALDHEKANGEKITCFVYNSVLETVKVSCEELPPPEGAPEGFWTSLPDQQIEFARYNSEIEMELRFGVNNEELGRLANFAGKKNCFYVTGRDRGEVKGQLFNISTRATNQVRIGEHYLTDSILQNEPAIKSKLTSNLSFLALQSSSPALTTTQVSLPPKSCAERPRPEGAPDGFWMDLPDQMIRFARYKSEADMQARLSPEGSELGSVQAFAGKENCFYITGYERDEIQGSTHQ